jgi:hypothetical protein
MFVANRVGDGLSPRTAFRPNVDASAVGGRIGSLPLTANRYLCVAPNQTGPVAGAIDLGDTVAAVLTGQRLTRAAAALDVTTAELSGMTIGEALWLWFQRRGENPRTGNRWKIRLAGVNLLDRPVIEGGATDSFTYSNGDLSVVSSGVWEAVGSNTQCDVASNAAIAGGLFTFSISRFATAFDADHYSQAVMTHSSGTSDCGVFTRMPNTTALTGYYMNLTSGGAAELYSVSGGSFGSLDSASAVGASGTIKLVSAGNLHTGYRNDVEVVSSTNTDHTSNTKVGIGGWQESSTSSYTWDNWAGGDGDGSGGGPVVSQPVRRRPLALTYR